jgi:hypothetical protein
MPALAQHVPEAEELLAACSSAERFGAVLSVILDETPPVEARSSLLLAALLAGPVDELPAVDVVATWQRANARRNPRPSAYEKPIRELVAAEPGRLSANVIAKQLGCSLSTTLRVLQVAADASVDGWTLKA